MKRSILISLMAIACGGATGTEKQGPALVTLHGQLVGGSAASTTGPVTVAIAWYPVLASNFPGSAPKSIVTQKVTFQGNFPVDFTLQLDGPPPDDALVDLAQNGGHGKAAYGALIAFEDRNGNGQLDLIPAGGAPVDKIVGSSIGDPSLVMAAKTFSIQYLDGTPGPGDQLDVLGGAQGYNLMEGHYWWGVERVPLDTSLSISITGSPALDIMACPSDFAGAAWQTSCGIDPYAGGYQLFGNVFTYSDSRQPEIILQVYEGPGSVDNASVDFNGTPVVNTSAGSDNLGYQLSGVSGTGTLHLSVPGHAAESLALTVLPKMTLTRPSSLTAGSDLTLSWTPVSGIEFYDVTVGVTTSTNPPQGKTLLHQLIPATQATVPAVPAGTVTMRVTAVGNPVIGSAPNSYMQPVSLASGVVNVTP